MRWSNESKNKNTHNTFQNDIEKKKKDINNDDQIQIYQKADSVLNCQTNISQNVQYLIDNNPIPFVKIKKKIKT